jgi:hypothetical protein
MNGVSQFLNNGGMTWLLIVGGITVLGIISAIIMSKRQKKIVANFLEENPNAVKVYLTSKAFITQEAVMIHTVNAGNPILFTEKGKSGFYLIPGESTVGISYTYTRPGVMYRSITKSTGLVERELEVEENKSYSLSFNRKEEDFVFEEM